MRINYWVQPVTYISTTTIMSKSNIFKQIHKQELSAKPTNTKPLAMYHMKIFEACKYSRVEGPIHCEGESTLTQI